IPVVSSGGVYKGLDAAKALSLGADLAALARPLLKCAVESAEKVVEYLRRYSLEIKATMYGVGAKNVKELRKAKKVILSPLREWAEE
ncbi:MAG: alpha-hydroxy-acid oxidizing protein, partial [Candidatus Micrarchaeaceae archaeon]